MMGCPWELAHGQAHHLSEPQCASPGSRPPAPWPRSLLDSLPERGPARVKKAISNATSMAPGQAGRSSGGGKIGVEELRPSGAQESYPGHPAREALLHALT